MTITYQNLQNLPNENLCDLLEELSRFMKEDNKEMSASIVDEAIRRLLIKPRIPFNDEAFSV